MASMERDCSSPGEANNTAIGINPAQSDHGNVVADPTIKICESYRILCTSKKHLDAPAVKFAAILVEPAFASLPIASPEKRKKKENFRKERGPVLQVALFLMQSSEWFAIYVI